MKKILFIFLALQICLFANKTIINGKTLIIEQKSNEAGILKKDKKTIKWLAHPNDKSKLIAIVPIRYYAKKDFILTNEFPDYKEKIYVNVKKGDYKKEKITIGKKGKKSKVKPASKKLLERIKQEREEANRIYSTFTPKRHWKHKFKQPLTSKITSDFGVARLYNGILRSYHGGTDFRAATGTKIKASNDGIVVIARQRYYAGGSVVIDHGEGIYSLYYHLSKVHVKVGDRVKQDEVVGLSGATGRVTGPHLHFGFMVRGTQVDPLDFIAKINALFDKKSL